MHDRGVPLRVEFIDGWSENQIGAGVPTKLDIRGKRPWIGIEILVRSELKWIDEDADDHTASRTNAPFDQFFVADVQRPHGWDEYD